MHYTQDESYYLLDAAGKDPCVYLGIKTGTKPEEMIDALQTARTAASLSRQKNLSTESLSKSTTMY